jgi:hypothetical protein
MMLVAEESAKSKAAKEVIKSLTAQVNIVCIANEDLLLNMPKATGLLLEV